MKLNYYKINRSAGGMHSCSKGGRLDVYYAVCLKVKRKFIKFGQVNVLDCQKKSNSNLICIFDFNFVCIYRLLIVKQS